MVLLYKLTFLQTSVIDKRKCSAILCQDASRSFAALQLGKLGDMKYYGILIKELQI
jgi:hypothetical protein